MKILIFLLAFAFFARKSDCQTWLYFDSSNSILTNSMIRAIKNNESTGDIWILNSNLIQITNDSWYNHTLCPLVGGSLTKGFFFDSFGEKWFPSLGNYCSILVRDSSCTDYMPNCEQVDYAPDAIYIDKYDNKWMGSSYWPSGSNPVLRTVIYKFNGISWQTWQISTKCNVSSIVFDHNNIVWVGTKANYDVNGIFSYNGTSWINYNSTNSILPYDASIYSLKVDELNNKWIGTYIGLIKFNDTTFTLTADLGFPVCQVFDIEIDSFGVLWCATSLGLVRYDGISTYTYNTSNTTLPSNSMKFVTIDGQNNIWLAFNNVNGVAKCEGLITGSPKLKEKSHKLKIYPNPSGNKIKISIPSQAKESGVSIYNISGSEVFKEQFKGSEIEINTESFQKGVYLLKVSYGNEVFNDKVVIQ